MNDICLTYIIESLSTRLYYRVEGGLEGGRNATPFGMQGGCNVTPARPHARTHAARQHARRTPARLPARPLVRMRTHMHAHMRETEGERAKAHLEAECEDAWLLEHETHVAHVNEVMHLKDASCSGTTTSNILDLRQQEG